MKNLNDYIKEKAFLFLKKHELISSKRLLLVGFSGGYDSTCLLNILYQLSKKYEFSLAAAHLNHNWRGKESDQEEINAKNFCNSREIEFFSKKLAKTTPKTEEEARNKRYEFFEEVAQKIGTNTIITGHTQSDQTETLLYRIIKGTGLNGLKGIPEMREHNCTLREGKLYIYRPLLEIKREETIKYCEINNLNPNNDSSNHKQDFARNKIRINLLPELKTYNSCVEGALLRLSEVAFDAEELIKEHLEEIKSRIYITERVISSPEYEKLSLAAKKRVLCDLYTSSKIEFDYKKIMEAINFIGESTLLTSGNTLSISSNKWLFSSKSEIKVINNIKSNKILDNIEFNIEGETIFPSLNKCLKSECNSNKKAKKFPKETDNELLADLSKAKRPLFLRTRRDGDIIQPFGMQEKTKLKKYLINKGVPEHKRDEILLLVDEKEVLWAIGVGISELLRVDKIPTHKIKVI